MIIEPHTANHFQDMNNATPLQINPELQVTIQQKEILPSS